MHIVCNLYLHLIHSGGGREGGRKEGKGGEEEEGEGRKRERGGRGRGEGKRDDLDSKLQEIQFPSSILILFPSPPIPSFSPPPPPSIPFVLNSTPPLLPSPLPDFSHHSCLASTAPSFLLLLLLFLLLLLLLLILLLLLGA